MRRFFEVSACPKSAAVWDLSPIVFQMKVAPLAKAGRAGVLLPTTQPPLHPMPELPETRYGQFARMRSAMVPVFFTLHERDLKNLPIAEPARYRKELQYRPYNRDLCARKGLLRWGKSPKICKRRSASAQ